MKYVSCIAALLWAAASGFVHAAVFSNTGTITLPTGPSGTSPGSPYPSTISVAGMSGTITTLRVTLNNINHDRPDDLQILLVSPTGRKFVLLSDAGGTGTPAAGINLTFDDAAVAFVPDAGPLATGSFKPTCVDAQINIQTEFAAPAPAGPYDVPAPRGSGTLALSFNGTAPNGTWSLYVVDDIPSSPGGAITGGWSLDVSTGSTTAPSVTTVTSSLNPSFTGNAVTFTATVRQTNNAAITSGGVIFREGVTVLQGSNVVNAMGQVAFTTSALTEGVHIITAEYTGNASFFASSATITQRVDTATTISGNTFANRGAITVGDTANVYPSRIFVTNLSGTISKVTMNLSNVTHARPDDFEVLLVAPNGAHFIVMTDAGGTLGMNNVTLNFDDAAAGLIPDAAAPGTGNYRPTSYNSTPSAFPPPAPAAPYNHPAPAGGSTFANIFNGANPNGTWSLYLVDDVAGDVGTIAGGWSLTFTTSGDAPTMTTLTSSLNPSLTGQSVTFTAEVRRVSNSAPVTNGTVTFREGPTPLAANVALNGSGIATFTTSGLAEGNHIISADYNGVPGSFNVSSASITQRVDNATVVNSNRFSNPGGINIPGDGNPPAVYPSRILISGAGVISNISVTVSNISIDRPADLELLLVSPTGARMILLSDAGGTVTPANNVTLDFSDAGGSFVASDGPMVTGTFKPTSVNTTPPNFPPPAPPSPYNHPGPFGTATLGSVFGGANPNGYWSLYVVDDVAGSAGTIGNGWSITLSTPPSITCPSNIVTTNALGQCQSAPVSFAATGGGFPAPTVRYQIAGTNVTSPLIFPVGVTTVTSIASNSFGTINCTFTVTVNDVQRPTIQCSTNILISRDPGVLQGPVFFNVSASDNCSAPILVVTPASGANFGFGVTTVNAVATDAAGNSNTCSFTVTVNRNPVALPNSFTTPTNTLLNIPASVLLTNDSDGDGDPISVSSVDPTSVNGGTVTFAAGTVTYRPPTNFFGSDYFQYTIADTRGGAASNLVIVSVTRADGLRLSLTKTNTTWWLRFVGAPGHTYLFQRADNVTGPWTNFAQAVAPTNTIILTNDPASLPLPRRFYRAVELPPGGLSLWRGESNALDTFGRAHGTLLNGVGFAAGRLGRAFSFNGVDGLITNSGASIPIPWTASMWVNRQPSLDPSALLIGDDVSALKLEQFPNTQSVGFTAYGVGDFYFNYTAPAGTWVHLVFVGTATGTRLYVNGVLTDINPATIPLGTRDMGRRPVQERLNGLLDEVSIFNRALSPVEIKALYYSAP